MKATLSDTSIEHRDPMITHYGLFWSERDVFWGRQNDPGELSGREKTPLGRRGAPTKAERRKVASYREYVGLYCLYGDGGLLYIGEAGLATKSTLFTRLKSHRRDHLAGRWDKFSWYGRKSCDGECDTKLALHQLEAIAISIINPGFNRQSGTFGKAMQVFQVSHEKAEGDLDTKIERILGAVNRNATKSSA